MAQAHKTPARPPATQGVSPELFQQVYDSPASLPGKEGWVTTDADVRKSEEMLGMAPQTIGAPLWVSGDTRRCPHCGRETNWLDTVGAAPGQVNHRELLARVMRGEQKFVNTEAPRAIADLVCYGCHAPIQDLRSFKCHNWAYARGAMLKVLEQMRARG